MKNKKKLTKIIFGTLGIVSIGCIIPACVVSCGSSNANNQTPSSSPTTTSSSTSSTTNPTTPNIGSANLSAMVSPSTTNLKGIQYQTNEFGFGSSVTLNAKFNEPKLNLTTGQKATVNTTYSWFVNGSTTPIKDATSDSYVISMLNANSTYQVNVAYTITITDGTKTINTIKNTVSDAIKLSVNNADLHVSLSYGNNETNTITDYGSQTFTTNIYAVFGPKSTDQITLSPSDFPSGYSLVFQELDLPSNKVANDVLPSAISLHNASSLSATFNVNQSYPLVVNLQQDNKVITTSNAINVCGYIKTDANINLNSKVPTTSANSGLALSTNNFAFGSKVVLTANFTQPVFELATNQAVEVLNTIYTWTINGKTITTTNDSYTINALDANSSYSVAITYMYQIINSKTKAALTTPISGTLSYSKNINLNVDYSNIKLSLSASNLNKNNQITSFGYQTLTSTFAISFDNNKTFTTLSASDFSNLNSKISFGTLTDNKYNAFVTNDAADANGWSTSYIIENATQLQAQIIINGNKTIKSNVIATDIVNPSVGLSANVSDAKGAVGKQISTNEFAFGSQVQLTADFAHPTINSGTGYNTTSTISYTWYKNGSVIKGANSSTYTIPYFLTSDSYSVSVNWNWSITKDDTSTVRITNLQSSNQIYKSANLNLTVDNSNRSFTLTYGTNNETSTITTSSTQILNAIVSAKFGNTTITVPSDELVSNFSNWRIEYQRYSFNQWNTLNSVTLADASALSYKYNPTGIYPIQALLITNNQTYTSNMIKVNTSYNDDVLGFDNLPTSLQSKYNCLTFIQNYIVTSMQNQGDNSPFLQQVNSWANGYKLVLNAEPASDQESVPVAASDLTNIQATWTNPNDKVDGVTVSATIANSNGLQLITWNDSEPYYDDPGSINLSKGDVIKWLLPFGTSKLQWSVTNNEATANFEMNLSLTPYIFTSYTNPNTNQTTWHVYLQGDYLSLPNMSGYYWGFTVENASGQNLLSNIFKTNSWYKKNTSDNTQWIVSGSFPLLGDQVQNPQITFDSTTSTIAQQLYEASIAGISSLQ